MKPSKDSFIEHSVFGNSNIIFKAVKIMKNASVNINEALCF